MSLSGISFLGATVKSVVTSIGLGTGQPSQLDVTLVEDTVNGDAFSPPVNGQPVIFAVSDFRFAGLLQKYTKNKSPSGELYTVTVVDPRMILGNAQVILGGYSGTTNVMSNLYNVYGFWESTGYGNSLANEGGMLWTQIRSALTSMINGAASAYGGPLSFMGYTYRIDLSQMPTPPSSYRIPTTSINLLDLISEICTDGGHEFFVTLEPGNVIKIRTISRVTAPPLGTVSALIESAETSSVDGDKLARSSAGVEIRNEINSTFLVGGEVTVLHQTNDIRSFWGLDINNDPIIGIPAELTINDENNNLIMVEPMEIMFLNATPVADVVGDTSYLCSDIEMRLALRSRDSWEAYMTSYKPALSALIGLESPEVANPWLAWFQAGFAGNINPLDFQNDLAGTGLTEEEFLAKKDRLYNFVRSTAEKFLGRSYVVGIPFLARAIESETGNITYSHVPTVAGFLEEGASPLGLSLDNEDVFTNNDGRFISFVQYENLGSGFDLSRGDMRDAVLELDGYDVNGSPLYDVYTRCNLDERVVFAPNPCAIIELPFAVHKVPQASDSAALRWAARNMAGVIVAQPAAPIPIANIANAVGGNILAQVAQAELQNVERRLAFGILDVDIDPPIQAPSYAAIPLKSNILKYGPWTALGATNGKVNYIEDSSLTPWNYGSYDAMNAAAAAKLANAATSTQLVESGYVDKPGYPSYNLGDVYTANGPNITNIRINFSETEGARTTYEFSTYTPRFGTFSRGQSDNIKRLNTASRDMRRELRARNAEKQLKLEAIHGAVRGFQENWNRLRQRRSPHPILVSQPLIVNDQYRVGTSLMTPGEAISAATANFDDMAVMSVAGLFRPASTQSHSLMPQYSTGSGVFNGYQGSDFLPFRQLGPTDAHVADWLSVGTGYIGLNVNTPLASSVHDRVENNETQRFLCHNGPMVLSGWGYTVDGKAVPSDDGGATHASGYISDSRHWKCGAIDLLWDDVRGVWTMPRMAKGLLDEDLPVLGSGWMHIAIDKSGTLSNTQLMVHNFFQTAVSSGTRVIAQYDAYEAEWYITAADCV